MAMLLSCCTSDELLVADATEGIASEGASVITFTAGVGTTTRADSDEELQTEDEKTVTSLYAVLFASSSVSTSGETNTETGTETLVGYYAVDGISSTNALSSSTTYTLTIDDEDDDSTTGYQLCFVANVSASLLSNNLTEETSTVSDLKALVVSQEPKSPFVMTSSSFYGIVKGQTTTLTSVSLKRIVARIDIQNCGGVIITKATMKNRAVKSVLINDNSTTTESDYLETSDAVYTIEEGSQSDATSDEPVYASQSAIYSYEQLCSDDSAPVITLTYKFSSSDTEEQTVDVKFVTTDDSGSETALYIKRNHYYLIKVSANEEEEPALEFELSVADWDEGETFTVANSTFTSISDPYAGVSVGDFIMSDGSLLKVSTDDSGNTTFSTVNDESVATTNFSDSYYPIAVVFYVLDDDDDSEDTDSDGTSTNSSAKSLTRSMSASDRFGIEAYKALGGAVHGKALALKNAAEQSNWAEGDYATTATKVLDLCPNIEETYADYDGYGNCQAILKLVSDGNTFPDFTYAKSNNDVSAPSNTTGWYLPAMGEWYDIIEGLASEDLSSYTTSSNATNNTKYDSTTIKYWPINDKATTVINALDAAMSVAGSTYYDAIEIDCFYTTSTETSASTCRNVSFKSSNDKLTLDAYLKKSADTTQRVRSVLAF